MRLALTRPVSPSIVRCELTHLKREPIDLSVATRQHDAYEAALETLGCKVQRLPAEPDLPDAVFVEDTAVAVDEAAVLARPGAASRRPETATVAEALRPYRTLHRIEPPGTLDGGDVLSVGRRIYVGLSSRTNADGARQLQAILQPMGYGVDRIAVGACLHLKSAVTALAEDRVLLNPRVVDAAAFEGLDWTPVDPLEPFAANVLAIGRAIICPAGAPRTQERLERLGYRVVPVDVSELAKAEGGVTCCSLILEV